MDDLSSKLQDSRASIKVYGVGGAGNNAVNNMIASGLAGVEFYAANTDAQALNKSAAQHKALLGAEITKGLGAGGNPDVGYAAAKESVDKIREDLEGADMVFITCGMGGGTGTLGSTVAAQVARELGCLTVGVVTKPFVFEGKRRMRQAERGIEELKSQVDTLITIPNQRLLSIAGRNTSMLDTFKKADDVLYQAVKGISDLITTEGLVNVDFADVRAVMSEMGMAMMGTGESSGENRAIEAAEKAVSSPLLEDISINGARGILINVTASPDVTLPEISEAAEMIHEQAHEDANIIWGMVIDPNLEDTVRVTVIATGFDEAVETKSDFGTTSATKFGGITRPTVAAAGSSTHRPSWLDNQVKKNEVKPVTPAVGTKNGDVVKVSKISVLASEDEGKYEIPTFLRKQMD